MDFSLKEILLALFGSGGTVVVLFGGIKFLYERLDLGKTRKKTDADKAYEAVWKLYEAALNEIERQRAVIKELEKGDSLARPTVSKIYQAVRKLGRQIEILDSVFIKEFSDDEISSSELQMLCSAVKKEMEMLWQKFDELEKTLP